MNCAVQRVVIRAFSQRWSVVEQHFAIGAEFLLERLSKHVRRRVPQRLLALRTRNARDLRVLRCISEAHFRSAEVQILERAVVDKRPC